MHRLASSRDGHQKLILAMTLRSRPFPASSQKTLSSRGQDQSIDRVVAYESLRNERKLAYIRALVVLISSVLDTLVFFFPQALIGQDSVSPSIALIGWSASLVSITIVVVLRRTWSQRGLNRLQLTIPVFDGLLIFLFITNIWHVFGEIQPQIITNITALCCLLAISGGMRFNRRASWVTTAFAVADFVYAAYLFELDHAIALFATVTVFGTGLLGRLISGIVHRQVNSQAGRLLMERFLPATLVSAAFETPQMVLQQRPRVCEVTIVMTDLRSFTHYSQNLDPEVVLEFLSQVQGLLSRIVEQHGGWVDKFMGDGMLAVFGATTELTNHAQQAVAAAVAILQETHTVSPLAIGIGVHSGSVVAGCLGTSGHLEFTVIGDTVNVASRIESLTKEMACPLLISEVTQRQLPDGALQSLGRVNLRGRVESLELFTVAAGRGLR